jgi:KDO2-lipid IV(A) lauroyltransferase
LRYRRNVVAENLRFAFPEKSTGERSEIEKAFFHHFCDFLFESIKTLHLSKAQFKKRFIFINPEILNNYHQKNKSVVLVSGHYGNWEWMASAEEYIKHKYLAIYKPLANKQYDRLIKNIRKKHTSIGEMVSMNDTYKVILQHERNKQLFVTWFLGDQSPPKDYPLWIKFMNRETPFYSGPEKIAKKFGHAVVFMNIKKAKRGYYEVEFIPMFDDPKSTAENEITIAHVKMLEDIIRKKPEYWLWSHRRWKHTRDIT